MTTQTIHILNKVLATISILLGLYFCYVSGRQYYYYTYTGILFFIYLPFKCLVVDFLLGLTAIIGGLTLFKKNPTSLIFYYSLGAGLLFYSMADIITNGLGLFWILETIGKLLAGLIILLYFNLSIIIADLGILQRKKSLLIGTILGFATLLIPFVLFHNYGYG